MAISPSISSCCKRDHHPVDNRAVGNVAPGSGRMRSACRTAMHLSVVLGSAAAIALGLFLGELHYLKHYKGDRYLSAQAGHLVWLTYTALLLPSIYAITNCCFSTKLAVSAASPPVRPQANFEDDQPGLLLSNSIKS